LRGGTQAVKGAGSWITCNPRGLAKDPVA